MGSRCSPPFSLFENGGEHRGGQFPPENDFTREKMIHFRISGVKCIKSGI
jgi:hypothetical protein